MRRRIRFTIGSLLASTFWFSIWLGSFVSAYRMFRLKLPLPITLLLGFALWALIVAAPVVGVATLFGRTRQGLQFAGMLILSGLLVACFMLTSLIP